MIRTLLFVGMMALAGLVVLKLVFGLLGPLVGLLLALLWMALRVLLLCLVVYFVLRVVSPATAERVVRAFRGQ